LRGQSFDSFPIYKGSRDGERATDSSASNVF